MSGTPGSSAPSPNSGENEEARALLLEQKRAFLAAVIDDLAPVGFVETRSAAHIAILLWRLKRISRIDVGFLLMESFRKRRERITSILEKTRARKSAAIDQQLAEEIRKFVKEQGLSISLDAKGNPKQNASVPPEYAMMASILEHEKEWLRSLEFELKQSTFARKTRLEIEAIDASQKAMREEIERLTKIHGPPPPSLSHLTGSALTSSAVSAPRPPEPPKPIQAKPSAPIRIDESLLKTMPDWFKDGYFDFGEVELDPYENLMAPEDYETDGIDKLDDDLGEFGLPEPDAS